MLVYLDGRLNIYMLKAHLVFYYLFKYVTIFKVIYCLLLLILTDKNQSIPAVARKVVVELNQAQVAPRRKKKRSVKM